MPLQKGADGECPGKDAAEKWRLVRATGGNPQGRVAPEPEAERSALQVEPSVQPR